MIPNRRRGRGDGPGLWPVVKSALPPALWPAIGFLAVLYVLPLGQVLPLSVVEPTPGIDNYVRLATTPLYALVLKNTFEISLVVAAICLILGYPTAYLLATCRPQVRSILLVFVLVPFFTSILVRTYSWIFLLGWKGIINTTLLAGGVIDEPLELLYNRFGVIVGMVHVLLPYMILILFSVMRGIDRKLVAAAASLSATPFTAFRRVYLPLSLPGIGSGFLLVLVLALAFFITPAMLGGPKDLMIANVIAYQIGVLKWGFASALAVVLLVVSIAFLVVTQWFFGGVTAITGGSGSAMTWRRSKVREGPVTQYLDRLLEPVWRHVPTVLGGLVLTFLIVPVFVMVPLSLNPLTYFVFPPEGISFRWYAAYLGNRDWLEATWNSLQIGLMTVAGTMALAVPASLGIARSSSRLTMAAYAFIVSPMIVPAIITAIAIFFLMSKVGLVGTTVGVTLGHMVGALPLATVVLTSALRNFDRNLERASLSLGVGPVRTTVKIVLPTVGAAVWTSAFFAFLHSFDELIIALFVSGIRARTLPKKMWDSLQEIEPTIAAVSTLLVLFTIVLLVAVHFLRLAADRRASGRAHGIR